MSWLRRLLTGWAASPQTEPRSQRRVRVTSYGERIVSVSELDLMGQRSTSPNGRYSLIWQDRGWNGTPADPRGRYVLIDGDTVVVDGRMERPQDGKVANDGTFVLNDWGLRDELAGTFTAFRADGSEIVSRGYTANLLNNGLSVDGRLAVCQTCNSPGSPDSSILTVFDLIASAVVATWTAESGWASSYEFPPEGDRIRMVRRDRVSLEYSLDGEFLDRQLWFQDEVRRGTLYVIRKALADGEGVTGLSLAELRVGVRAAVAEGDARFTADAWRLLGEIEEADGNLVAALEAYDKALHSNPKVGVAKRAAALRKSLAQNGESIHGKR